MSEHSERTTGCRRCPAGPVTAAVGPRAVTP